MSFASGTGNSGAFPIYTNPGYSSSSDVEGANNITDYSDHEAGYSSAASTGFDFVSSTAFQPSQRVPPYAAQPRYNPASSQSPPHQVYSGIPTPISTLPGQTGGTTATAAGNSTSQQYQRIARFVGPPPVALACTECRSRHLKCDAGIPACSRCLADKRECSYVKSRRGWKGTRRKKQAIQGAGGATTSTTATTTTTATTNVVQSGTDMEGPEVAPEPAAAASNNASAPATPAAPSGTLPKKSPPLPAPPPVPLGNFSPPPTAPHTNPLETLRAAQKNSTKFPSQQEPANDPPPTANLMQLYYAYFHAAHPFVLPPAYLIKTSAHQLTVLLPVMRYIASVFTKTAPTETFCREAENALFGSAHPAARNPFTVQALLLFAIGLHSENEQERAAQVKDIACDLALELGMNTKEFSEVGSGGEGDAGRVLEESWRRTWWELYFIDGLLAGIHQRDHFKLWSVECTVPLPCEEADYAAGCIPEPQSLQDFDDRYFAQDNTVFSSFAYRVEAIRILGQVLAVGAGGSPDGETRADAADASLANWGLHLPDAKKELVNRERKLDEMLFQAHMVVNGAIIYLNRPKSHLAISIIPDDTSCTPPTSWSTPTKPMALHTARTLTAANTISKLITLPHPLIKHSPFFTCIVVLSAVVHLSACSWLLSGDEGFLAKERIRLAVGALKGLEGTWKMAAGVLSQVKYVSREVFRLPPPEGGGGGGVSEEEVLRFIEEEREDWEVGLGLEAEWDGGVGL